jgi:hypothetical protein
MLVPAEALQCVFPPLMIKPVILNDYINRYIQASAEAMLQHAQHSLRRTSASIISRCVRPSWGQNALSCALKSRDASITVC